MRKDRAQAIILKNNQLLMVNHLEVGKGSFWCLPGGSVEVNESPEEAVVREVYEECCVESTIIRKISAVIYESGETHHTFLLDISGTPSLGEDPELDQASQILKNIDYVSFDELSEIDRLFLCQAGALSVSSLEKFARNAYPSNPAPNN